jgi:putative intracellular protease/amidase
MKSTKTIMVLAITILSTFVIASKATAQTGKKVLIVLTSHEDLGNTGKKTGYWLEEFSDPYYLLIDNGIQVTLASPKGGKPPMDPSSASENYQTEGTKRFMKDTQLQELLSKTLKLATIKVSDYDAVYFPGGHGPLWDLAEDKNSIALIEGFFTANKPVAAACHAPAIFKNTKKLDGSPLVKGLKVTGFSNSEETASGLAEVVPFLVEGMLTENGAIYSKGADWEVHVIEDNNLITGQNPASAKGVAEKLLNQLKH